MPTSGARRLHVHDDMSGGTGKNGAAGVLSVCLPVASLPMHVECSSNWIGDLAPVCCFTDGRTIPDTAAVRLVKPEGVDSCELSVSVTGGASISKVAVSSSARTVEAYCGTSYLGTFRDGGDATSSTCEVVVPVEHRGADLRLKLLSLRDKAKSHVTVFAVAVEATVEQRQGITPTDAAGMSVSGAGAPAPTVCDLAALEVRLTSQLHALEVRLMAALSNVEGRLRELEKRVTPCIDSAHDCNEGFHGAPWIGPRHITPIHTPPSLSRAGGFVTFFLLELSLLRQRDACPVPGRCRD